MTGTLQTQNRSTRNSTRDRRSGISFWKLVLPAFLILPVFLAGCSDSDASDDVENGNDSTEFESTGLHETDFIEKPIYYAMNMDMKQTMTVEGKEMESRMKSAGTIRLGKTAEKDGKQEWLATTELSMSGNAGGQKIDSMKQKQDLIYVLSDSGELLDIEVGGDGMNEASAQAIQQVMQKMSARQNAVQFFLQNSWLGKKDGDTWEVPYNDTIELKDMPLGPKQEKGSMTLILDMLTKYTSRGEIDTLGTRGMKLDFEISKMKLNGSVKTESGEMLVEVDALGFGTTVFSLADKLQLASNVTTNMNTVLSIPGQPTMPMVQSMTMRMVRQDR